MTTSAMNQGTAAQQAELISQKFDLAIALVLSKWPALSDAVANHWGGPASADKRDWLAGAISELFDEHPGTDEGDVQEVLLQVMIDEFDVQVEDDSEERVAVDILRLRKQTQSGDFREVDELQRKWQESNQRGGRTSQQVQIVEANDDDDVEWSSDEDDDGGGGVDIEMSDAPALIPAKEKTLPEVDEDGFTKVMGKKKR